MTNPEARDMSDEIARAMDHLKELYQDPNETIRTRRPESERFESFKIVRAALAEQSERERVLRELPARVLAMCKHRGWSMCWTHRGAYLHLESSELIEAIRGKRGDPAKEAGDVLLVLMSITEHLGIPFADVIQLASDKNDALMKTPRYKGEEHDGSALLNQEEPE